MTMLSATLSVGHYASMVLLFAFQFLAGRALFGPSTWGLGRPRETPATACARPSPPKRCKLGFVHIMCLILVACTRIGEASHPGPPRLASGITIASANVVTLRGKVEQVVSLGEVVCLQETRMSEWNQRGVDAAFDSAGNNTVWGAPVLGTTSQVGPRGIWDSAAGGVAITAAKHIATEPVPLPAPLADAHQQARIAHARVACDGDRCWINVVTVYGFAGANDDASKAEANADLFAKIIDLVIDLGSQPTLLIGDFNQNPQHIPCIAAAEATNMIFDVARQFQDEPEDTFRHPEGTSRLDIAMANGPMMSLIHSFCTCHQSAFLGPKGNTGHSPIAITLNITQFHETIKALSRPQPFLRPSGLPLEQAETETIANAVLRVHLPRALQAGSAGDVEQLFKVVTNVVEDFLAEVNRSLKVGSKGTRGRATEPQFLQTLRRQGVSKASFAHDTQRQRALWNFRNRIVELRRSRIHIPDNAPLEEESSWLHKPHYFAKILGLTRKLRCSPVFKALPTDLRGRLRERGLEAQCLDVAIEWCSQRMHKEDLEIARKRKASFKLMISDPSNSTLWKRIAKPGPAPPTSFLREGVRISGANDMLAMLSEAWSPILNRDDHAAGPSFSELLEQAEPLLPRAGDIVLAPFDADIVAAFWAGLDAHTAPGLDSLFPAEVKSLPRSICGLQGFLLNVIESQHAWPRLLSTVLMAMLGKKGSAGDPLGVRGIGLTSLLYRLWSGVRASQLAVRFDAVLPPEVTGGRRGKSTEHAVVPLALALDHASMSGGGLSGICLDTYKYFDSVGRAQMAQILRHAGAPKYVVATWTAWYRDLRRWWRIGRATRGPEPSSTGIIQGCALSVVAVNLRGAIWANALRTYVPAAMKSLFIDDRAIYAVILGVVQHALHVTAWVDALLGDSLCYQKLVLFGLGTPFLNELRSLSMWSPSGPVTLTNIQSDFELLGSFFSTCMRRTNQRTLRMLDSAATSLRLVAAISNPNMLRKS